MNNIIQTHTGCWKALILSLILIMPCLQVFSQINQRRVDSLKTALANSTGQRRYDILDKLAYEYVWVVDTIALPFATEAFEMSWQFGDSARIVKSGRTKAMAFNGLGKYDSTIALSSIVLPIAKRNNNIEEVKRLLNLAALAYSQSARYDKALSYNFESLALRKKYGDSLAVSIALNNVGLVYFKIEDFERAAYYFEEALDLRSLNDDRKPNIDNNYYVQSLTNVGTCYIYLNDFIRAKHYIDKASIRCEAGCSDLTMTMVYSGLGLLLLRQGDLDKATDLFLQSLAIARKISSRRSELEDLIWLSEIALKLNQTTLAEKYLLQAEPLFDSDIPLRAELAEVYDLLGDVYLKLGNYRKAGYFQSKYINLSKKIYSMALTTNLMKIQAEYQERENRAKIDSQEKILALNDVIIARQHVLNLVIGTVAALSIALVVALMQNVRQKKAANNLLEQKVRERTFDLECKHDLLVRLMHERDLEMQRMSNEIKASLSTIRGLGLLVLHDVNLNSATAYVNKIEQTSNNLLEGLNLSKSNNLGS